MQTKGDGMTEVAPTGQNQFLGKEIGADSGAVSGRNQGEDGNQLIQGKIIEGNGSGSHYNQAPLLVWLYLKSNTKMKEMGC